MANNNKKWIIGGSITLLVVLGASIGSGALIGAFTKKEPNFIKIHAGDKVFTDINLGSDKTSDADKAKMLEAQFLSASLFGVTDVKKVDLSVKKDGSYILGTGNDWNVSHQLSDATITIENLKDSFVEMKFLNKTQDSSVIDYLSTIAASSQNQLNLNLIIKKIKELSDTKGLIWAEVTGLDIISQPLFNTANVEIFDEDFSLQGTNLIDAIQTTLLSDYNYQSEILSDMTIYSYLWQNASQKAYDYNLTKELAYVKASLTSSLSFDTEKVETSPAASGELSKIKDGTFDSTNADAWNKLYDDFKKDGYLIDDSKADDQIITGGFKGYDGVTFGTSAGTGIGSDWIDIENTWNYDETIGVGDSPKTNSGTYTHKDILKTSNLYQPKDGERGGLVSEVVNDPTNDGFIIPSGTTSIYMQNQLTPYVFKGVKSRPSEHDDPIMTPASFSLFANGDEVSGYTKADSEDVGANYIFDEWFGDNSLLGEIYITEALIAHNSGLKEKADKFWLNNGFYIELSGDYEDSLLNFIPNNFIKDEE